jgi:hypothetical protein
MVLFGGAGVKASLWSGQDRALTADTSGNVGIGTHAPQAKLEVHGDVRLGPNGQLRAPGGEGNLRIIRGTVDSAANILAGSGFSVVREGVGSYRITFDTPFAATPTVTVNAIHFGAWLVYVGTLNQAHAQVRILSPNGSTANWDFNFIAIGPR